MNDLASLVSDCWLDSPEDRPSVYLVQSTLARLLSTLGDDPRLRSPKYESIHEEPPAVVADRAAPVVSHGAIVHHQPTAQPLTTTVNKVINPRGSGNWSSGTCDCCVDGWEACCGVCCCTPCVFSKHAEVVGWDGCRSGFCFCLLYAPSYLLTGLPFIPLSCIIHAPLRRKIRERYGIKEGYFCEDYISTTFCTPCSLCQEAHEIKVHGEMRA